MLKHDKNDKKNQSKLTWHNHDLSCKAGLSS
jgi:hypothetical protein